MHVSWMSGRGRGVIQNQVFFFFSLSSYNKWGRDDSISSSYEKHQTIKQLNQLVSKGKIF